MPDEELRQAAHASRAWPFEEARKLLKHVEKQAAKGRTLLFETGYGPSGLPHIGTFGEVVRTTMVRHALHLVAPDFATRLICFSDDMDGLRKVPDNVPNQEMMRQHLGKPLTQVPDPFTNQYDSFGAANNARLRVFLDRFGFDYRFESATQNYTAGVFDEALLRMLAVYDEVMEIILPTLGEERRATYAPFLPICPDTGRVLQVPVIERNISAGTIVYQNPDTGKKVETPVTGGRVKCQWKADWALRWFALGVDYEMSGKDLMESVRLSSRICKALGGLPPEGLSYELFLDEEGRKISKSKGNGLTIDEWLRYGDPESLQLFMYQAPRKARRLYFDVIPKNVDDYAAHMNAFEGQDLTKRLTNPAFHIHSGDVPEEKSPVSFALLLNLVSASQAEDPAVLWGFIQRYAPEATPATHPRLDHLVGYALNYFHDFVKPKKKFRDPDDRERAALEDLSGRLSHMAPGTDAEAIQTVVYETGKAHGFDPLRAWFQALYEVLLGESQGPRFGSFVALYGQEESVSLIQQALAKSTES